MPIISIIVAIDENNAIGKDNNLLCHLPGDLKYFKSVTLGHSVIMGRKTYESLPNGALPNRRNIILSRKTDFKIEGCEIAQSLADSIALCDGEKEVFIIGGGSVYKEALVIADKLYVTHVCHRFEGADTFFPPIDDKLWKRISFIENPSDEKNKYPYNFAVYTRIK